MDNDLQYLMDEIKSDQKPVKPKRKKKKKRKGGARLILFLFVVLLVVMAGGVFVWWMNRPERKLPGSWHRSIDYTAEVKLAAKEWLMSAEGGDEIDLQNYLGNISVGMDLTLSKDGTWSCTIDENSYQAAQDKAYQALEEAFEDLLIQRVTNSGREMTTREEAAQSVLEAIDMTCGEYLRTYGPALLPEAESIRTQYAGSGQWRAESGVLLRDGNGMAFLINTDLLVLSGANGTEVYYRNAE